jgi:hypothetical protein
MTRQFVQDEAPQHGLFVDDELELPMPRHFVQDKALEHGLFVKDELSMPVQIVQDEP